MKDTTLNLAKKFPNQVQYIYYHENCMDGFCAAAVAQLAFKRAECRPIQYSSPVAWPWLDEKLLPPAALILFVDFFPTEEMIAQMVIHNFEWVAVDHHASAAQQARKYPKNCVFDENRSGARLTWDWLFPKADAPWLVNYVQDRDLWLFQMVYSQAMSAWISTQPLRIPHWQDLLRMKNPPDEAITVGKTILETRRLIYEGAAKKGRIVKIKGTKVVLKNATTLISETCNRMLEIFPEVDIAATYFLLNEHTAVISFRGREGANCIPLAQALHPDGGGHPRAAGVSLPLHEFLNSLEEVSP